MQQINVAVSSRNKIPAEQQNRINKSISQPEIPDLSFKSKGQIIRLFEVQCWELAQVKKEKDSIIEELLIEQVRLREKVKELNKEVSYYQDKVLEEIETRRDKTIKEKLDINYLKIAG